MATNNSAFTNQLNLTVGGSTIFDTNTLVSPIFRDRYNWNIYYVDFTISTAGTYQVSFNGTGANTTYVTALDYVTIENLTYTDNSWLNIYRDGSLNSLKINYSYNEKTYVDTKLMDYSANTIYNAFINVGKYGATKKTVFKAYAYDNSNN